MMPPPIMKAVPCNLCGRDDAVTRFPATLDPAELNRPDARGFRCTSPDYGRHARIVTCRHCGHVYANPVWEEHELLGLYATVEDDLYVRERHGRRLTFQKHLESLEKITGPSTGRTLLDVGAYIGVFVEVACAAGWRATGLEPSTWAVAEATAHDLPVIQGTLASPELTGRTFDVVTMWDVIEHVADPAAELARAFEHLNPGGFIAVHTMDIESLAARLMGPRWPWLMAMHIHFFSQRSLARLLEQSGFEIVWVAVQGRYLRLNYLASRLQALAGAPGRLFQNLIQLLDIADRPVPVNFGDLFTVYAKKVV